MLLKTILVKGVWVIGIVIAIVGAILLLGPLAHQKSMAGAAKELSAFCKKMPGMTRKEFNLYVEGPKRYRYMDISKKQSWVGRYNCHSTVNFQDDVVVSIIPPICND